MLHAHHWWNHVRIQHVQEEEGRRSVYSHEEKNDKIQFYI